MRLTPAEKQRNYRERQKRKGLDVKVKEKDRLTKQVKKHCISAEEKKRHMVQHREAQKKYKRNIKNKRQLIVRLNFGNLTPGTSGMQASPYKSSSAFRKAVKKAQALLPKSPRKQKKVIAALAAEVGIEIPKASKETARAMTEAAKDAVLKFFQ